jgi:hypothetical protein
MRLPCTALAIVSAGLICVPAGASVEAQELRETRTLALSESQLQDLRLDLVVRQHDCEASGEVLSS